MLPMFRGAEAIFRKILVPLAGLQELLMKKDADVVRRSILKDIPEHRRQSLMKEIGEFFSDESAFNKGSYQQIV